MQARLSLDFQEILTSFFLQECIKIEMNENWSCTIFLWIRPVIREILGGKFDRLEEGGKVKYGRNGGGTEPYPYNLGYTVSVCHQCTNVRDLLACVTGLW